MHGVHVGLASLCFRHDRIGTDIGFTDNPKLSFTTVSQALRSQLFLKRKREESYRRGVFSAGNSWVFLTGNIQGNATHHRRWAVARYERCLFWVLFAHHGCAQATNLFGNRAELVTSSCCFIRATPLSLLANTRGNICMHILPAVL
jgi:hypothetical protein